MQRLSLAALTVGIAVLLWASVANAASILFPVGGGTGTSTAPAYGKVLVGNKSGLFDYIATSTLGLNPATSTIGNLNRVIVVDGIRYTTVQQAINACASVGTSTCQTVYVPTGTYTSATSTVLSSGITLQCDNPQTVIKGTGSGHPTLITYAKGTSKTAYNNIGIVGCTIAHTNDHVMRIGNVDGLTIRSNYFTDYNAAGTPESLFVENSQNVSVTDNTVRDSSGDGIQLNAVNHFIVSNNRVINVYDDAIDIDSNFVDSGAYGTIPSLYGTVIGNKVVGNPSGNGNGIRVENTSYTTISGNQISSISNDCILANDTGSPFYPVAVTIANNQVDSCTNAGISIEGSNITGTVVTGNSVSNSGQSGGSSTRAGIQTNAQNTLISNNYVFSSGKNDGDGGGIVIYQSNGNSVVDNTIASTTNGINLWNGSGSVVYASTSVSGNSFTGVTTQYKGDSNAFLQAGVSLFNSTFDITGKNAKFGIGTSSPTQLLSVAGTIYSGSGGFKFPDGTTQSTAAGTNYWTLNGSYLYPNSGSFIGIGTTTPASKLQIQSSDSLGAEAGAFSIRGATTFTKKLALGYDESGDYAWILSTNTGFSTKNLAFSGSNFGFSTTSPQSKLSVSGNASIGVDYNTAAPTNGLIVEGYTGLGTISPTSPLTVISTDRSLTVPLVDIETQGAPSGSSNILFKHNWNLASGKSLVTIQNSGSFATAGDLLTLSLVNGSDSGRGLVISNSGTGSALQITNGSTGYGALIAGNVGIGTTSPTVLFDLFSTASTTLRVDSNASTKGGQLLIKDSDGSGYTCVTANNGVLTAKVAASATSC